MNVLGIETSCDETAAALVQDGRKVIHSAVASQMPIHRPYKGVVPELASRAHVERINQVIEQALKGARFDAVAFTRGPGLIGCLLAGAVTARTIAMAKKVPVVGVNHLEGHLFAGLAEHRGLKPPFLGLIVSGGHTELVIFKGYGRYERLGGTRDDAAGEAFDKVANHLGLPFPGGPAIDRTAIRGKRDAVSFPRARMSGTWDFSFSGLKTAVVHYLDKTPKKKRPSLPDLAASFQEAVVDVLVKKTLEAAQAKKMSSVVVGGGVAANRRLREAFQAAGRRAGIKVYLPDLSFCTDNAAMIASAGYYQIRQTPKHLRETLTVQATLPVRSWKGASR